MLPWLKALLLFSVASVLSLLAAEWIARLVLPPTWGSRNVTTFGEIVGPSPWPGVPSRLIPGASQLRSFREDPRGYLDPGATLTYRINALGFRGPETTWKKPAGHVRVVGLGDSFTFGLGVRVDDTFLADLEARLRSAGTPRPVEVLNLGVPGNNTRDQAGLLRYLGLRVSPDLVVICFFLNDAGGGSTSGMFNVRRMQFSRWRRSRLLDHLIFQIEQPSRTRKLISDYRRSFASEALGWSSAQKGMREAVALSKSNGFDLVLMIFPVLWQLSTDYPFLGIHEIVKSTAEALGIPVLDLLPAFAGHDGPELWVDATDQHPNEIAHAIAGEALFDFLVARGLPRLRLPPPPAQ